MHWLIQVLKASVNLRKNQGETDDFTNQILPRKEQKLSQMGDINSPEYSHNEFFKTSPELISFTLMVQ